MNKMVRGGSRNRTAGRKTLSKDIVFTIFFYVIELQRVLNHLNKIFKTFKRIFTSKRLTTEKA